MQSFTLKGAGREAIAPPPSDHVDARLLAASTAEIHAIPADANYVVFSATGDFYVRFGVDAGSAAAAIPAGDVTNGGASMVNPEARSCKGMTHIGLIAPANTIVTMEFYA